MEIVVYGKHNCPKCKQAVSLLETSGLSYQYKLIGEDISVEELCDIVKRQVRSAPVITSNGREVTFDQLQGICTTAATLSSLEL